MDFPCAHGLSRVRVTNRVDHPVFITYINNFSLDYVVKGKTVQTYKFANAKETYDIDIKGAAAIADAAANVAAAVADAPGQAQG